MDPVKIQQPILRKASLGETSRLPILDVFCNSCYTDSEIRRPARLTPSSLPFPYIYHPGGIFLNHTIAAIATPQAAGGIGVIRISGPKALQIADAVFQAASGCLWQHPKATVRILAEFP